MSDRDQFLYQLTKPVPGSKPSERQFSEDANAFIAFAGAMGVTPPAASTETDEDYG